MQIKFYPQLCFDQLVARVGFTKSNIQVMKIVFGESLKLDPCFELQKYDIFNDLYNEFTIRIFRNCNLAFLQIKKHHTIYYDCIVPEYTGMTCHEVNAKPTKVINYPPNS